MKTGLVLIKRNIKLFFKDKGMANKRGHYCIVCGIYKSNESFSGKGHAAHICKKCAALPASERFGGYDANKAVESPMAVI